MNGTSPSFDITGNASYNCVTNTGSISWNKATQVLTVAGTIFFDGNITSSNTGAMYHGLGTIYVNGTFALSGTNASFRAGCPASPAAPTAQCPFGDTGAGWNPSKDMIIFAVKKTGTTAVDFSGTNNEFQGGVICDPTSTIGSVGHQREDRRADHLRQVQVLHEHEADAAADDHESAPRRAGAAERRCDGRHAGHHERLSRLRPALPIETTTMGTCRTRPRPGPRPGLLPERRRRARAAAALARQPRLGLHGLRARDRVVRQRADRLVRRSSAAAAASCGVHIPIRYPAVELVAGLLFAACFWKFGLTRLRLRRRLLLPHARGGLGDRPRAPDHPEPDRRARRPPRARRQHGAPSEPAGGRSPPSAPPASSSPQPSPIRPGWGWAT